VQCASAGLPKLPQWHIRNVLPARRGVLAWGAKGLLACSRPWETNRKRGAEQSFRKSVRKDHTSYGQPSSCRPGAGFDRVRRAKILNTPPGLLLWFMQSPGG